MNLGESLLYVPQNATGGDPCPGGDNGGIKGEDHGSAGVEEVLDG
jgi:hypothetical protein